MSKDELLTRMNKLEATYEDIRQAMLGNDHETARRLRVLLGKVREEILICQDELRSTVV